MGKYLIDLDTLSPGAPTGMTRRWVTTESNWAVVDNAARNGTSNGLVSPSFTASARRALSFDALNSAAGREWLELFAEFKSSTTSPDARFLMRGSGAATTESGYVAGVSNGLLRISKYVGGTFTDLDSQAFTAVAGTWYKMRVRLEDSAGTYRIRVKVWEATASEPGSYQRNLNITASADLLTAGWVGLFQTATSSVTTWDRFIGVGTNGDAAPEDESDVTATVDAGADQFDVEPWATVSLAATTDEATAVWSQVSGPAITLTSTGAKTATFVAPPTLAGTDVVVRATVTNTFGTGSDDVNVEILPATDAIRAGGVWVPVRLVTP